MAGKRSITNPKASRPASITRRGVLFGLGSVAVIGAGALFLQPTPTMAKEVVVYRDPSCGCCGSWTRHMRQNGFSVTLNNVNDMDPIKRKAGIPEAMESCHTAYIDGYLVEGHVPAADIKRMLSERPTIKGLAIPGMPLSAPGMDNPKHEPFNVLAFDAKGRTSVFASY